MDIEKYISSGILERYVAGTLSEEENWEVYQNITNHTKIKEELLSIEAAILELSKTISPNISKEKGFTDLKNRIGKGGQTQGERTKVNWTIYRDRAAAILLAIVLLASFYKVSQLKSEINNIGKQNLVLKHQVVEARDSLAKTNELLNAIRGKNVKEISLDGQEASPTSFAKIYWNREEKKVYLDAEGLPKPPNGFVYQVWSLEKDLLAPTSIGLLEDLSMDENKIFVLSNTIESEAFGITLEPLGGSETPNLRQLFTLGTVPLKKI